VSENKVASYHYDYPSLEHFDSGQPRVTHGKGPINYAGLFKMGETNGWSVSFDEVPALGELGRLAVEDEALRARLLVPEIEKMDEWREHWVKLSAAGIPLDVLDRLMNTVGDGFTEDDFKTAWEPVRNGLVWEKLPVEVVVPVCLATFDLTKSVELAEGMLLEPLPEGEQRARVPKTVWDAAAHDCVIAAATHAVTIRGCTVDGPGRMLLEYGRREFYPTDKIELAFEALRIATSVRIGYAQIYMRPIGWAWHYPADLPPVIQGSISRRYPPRFEDYGWLRAAERITEAQVNDAAMNLAELLAAGESSQAADKSFQLASRRFSSTALRTEEDDAILDLCIALEAAVGDHDRNEMTYKLGLRTAAILALAGERYSDATVVMQRVKYLYGWRSAIVHGDDVEKARRKFLGEDKDVNGLDVATALVRHVLRQLVRRSDLRNANAIDTKLLLGELGESREV
jgi:hypothetical protein